MSKVNPPPQNKILLATHWRIRPRGQLLRFSLMFYKGKEYCKVYKWILRLNTDHHIISKFKKESTLYVLFKNYKVHLISLTSNKQSLIDLPGQSRATNHSYS